MKNELILVLDLGGQYKELIARTVRGLKVYAEVLPGEAPIEKIRGLNPIGIILSGGAKNSGGKAAKCDAGVLGLGVPVLEFPTESDFLQNGEAVIKNFLLSDCKASQDYRLKDYVKNQIQHIRSTVGKEKVLLALSGGVDSSVLAALLAKAVPEQLVCIFVDHGCMRLNEGNQIEETFSKMDMHFIRVNAADRFLKKLEGVTDPEKKRKIIGEEFIRVFEEEAKKLGRIPFLAQGTIYPDIIESGGANSANIKSHHNVGGLPETLDFDQLVEPLSGLFKNEVRDLGKQLKLPAEIVNRQPFPGPGLAVRVLGEVTAEKLDTLRHADAIFREEVGKLGKKPNQYFAILTDTRSVGVKDEQRTHDFVIALRAVKTIDFMTCVPVHIPYKTLDRVVERITGEIPQASRVVYDITPKPSGTIEWQ